MTTERTQFGRELETALGEVLAHVCGEIDLPCWIVDDPAVDEFSDASTSRSSTDQG